MPKISIFPVPRFSDLTFRSLQVLSENVLYFGSIASKTAKVQVVIFALYCKMVSKNRLRKVSLQIVTMMG